MAALTENSNIITKQPGDLAPEIVKDVTVFANGYIAIENEENATAATRGREKPWAKTSGQIPLGLSFQGGVGNVGATPAPDFPVRDRADVFGKIVRNIPVAGGADTTADHYKAVYCSTDNIAADCTFARPTAPAEALGFAIERVSSGRYDVYFWGNPELRLAEFFGTGADRMLVDFGCVGVGVVAPAPKTLAGAVKATFHGKLISVSARCLIKPTDLDVSLGAQVKINGVATTGGAMTLLFSDVAGSVKAGTAITGANFIHDGDDLSIDATTITADGTASDPGLFQVFGIVQKMAGI